MSFYLQMPIHTDYPYCQDKCIDRYENKMIVAATWNTIDGIHPLDDTMGGSPNNQPDQDGYCQQALVGVHAIDHQSWLVENRNPVPKWLIQFIYEHP